MTVYTCSNCKAVLPVVNGQPVRACECVAPIIAAIQAVATGAGGIK